MHPQLGTLDDLRFLVAEAARHGIELALDIAFQCSPDHPYASEHPEWFQKRPDGTIQYAENPPKKYQDIYPFHFESTRWRELWLELKSVLDFWIDHGVRIFRVDNPHTKPFAFWEWAIGEVKREHPDVIFLSEAFTRPKVMHRLAKLGFTQSYTYFAWRNTHAELKQYFTELTQGPGREYFRPNAWPNTPDILPEYLQFGGRPAFMVRLVLAATLAASYGIYGPAFELLEHEPREPGSEEYRDSEKYQIRRWDLDRPDSLRDFVARVNAIRRDNPALQSDWSLRFHPVDNESLLCYSKTSPDGTNMVFTVVNLDPHHTQAGWVELPLEELGLDPTRLVPGPRPAVRRPLSLARRAQLRGTRPAAGAGAHLPPAPPGAQRAGLRLLHVRTRAWTGRSSVQQLADTAASRLAAAIRCGSRTPSCTRCPCAPTATPTTTASAISPGSPASSTTSRSWGSTPSGCCPSTLPRSATTATTSPTITTCTRSTAPATTFAPSCARPTGAACG